MLYVYENTVSTCLPRVVSVSRKDIVINKECFLYKPYSTTSVVNASTVYKFSIVEIDVRCNNNLQFHS